MILPERHAKFVSIGRKTQLIRPWSRRLRVHPDDSRPVQYEKDGERITTEQVQVLAVHARQLHELTDAEARAEGFTDRDELFAWWEDTYNERPYSPFGNTIVPLKVQIVTFQLESRRLLADGTRIPSDPAGYSHVSGMAGEKEAVDEATQKRFTKEAQANDSLRRASGAERDIETLRAQLAALRSWAGERGVDARSEVRVLERRLQEKLRKRAA